MFVGLTMSWIHRSTPTRWSTPRAPPARTGSGLEQPARGGAALAALGGCGGCAAAVGPALRGVAAAWRELAGGAIAGDDPGPPGAAGRGRRLRVRARRRQRAALGGLRRRALVVPEVALARRDGEVSLTVADARRTRRRPQRLAERMAARSPACATPSCRCSTRARGSIPIAGVAPPGLRRGGRARRRADPGRRAREGRARARGHRPRPDGARRRGRLQRPPLGVRLLLRLLRRPRRERRSSPPRPSCSIRREGLRAQSVALAGSIRRSADPAVDDHLGEQLLGSAKDREEQAIVARRIGRVLRPATRSGSPRRASRP